MPVIRAQDALKDGRSDGDVRWHFSAGLLSDTGGLTQFGAFTETLPPGAQSSELHWHEKEDEFVYLISGQLVLVEGDESGIRETIMVAGDAATFKAGDPVGHTLMNRSEGPAIYLVVGTRTTNDHWHYPLKDEHIERDGKSRIVKNGKGEIIKTYEK
ncbi:MAG: cupin domain-containing protein [Notoacmeibacter sp.]